MEQHYELTSTPELLTLAVYVLKGVLVGHHWKERPIGLANRGMPGPKRGSGSVGHWAGGYGGLLG